jgi:hypothetical protein
MTMVGVGRKLFGSIDFYGDVRWALKNVSLAVSQRDKLPGSFTLDAIVPVLGNSLSDSEKLSPRIILRAFRVARREFV